MCAPDFYLASSDVTPDSDLARPRRCWRLRRLATDTRDDLLLVRIAPPLPGQAFGLGDREIDQLLLAARHKGFSLFPISTWPVYVHVARPLVDDIEFRDKLNTRELHSFAWAELYPTEEAARLKGA